jgi:hypothetical protein
MQNAPRLLYRFLSAEEHARDFIQGKIQVGLLTAYRQAEDAARRDDSEGYVSFDWEGRNIRYRGQSLNNFYILCMSGPGVMRANMAPKGNYCVRVDDPLILRDRIHIAWNTHECALNGNVRLVQIEYNKGEAIASNVNLIAPQDYVFSQKPPSFSQEKEFRYVLTCGIDVARKFENTLLLDIGNCSDICCME